MAKTIIKLIISTWKRFKYLAKSFEGTAAVRERQWWWLKFEINNV